MAGETGVATLAGVIVLAAVLLANAKVWKTVPVEPTRSSDDGAARATASAR